MTTDDADRHDRHSDDQHTIDHDTTGGIPMKHRNLFVLALTAVLSLGLLAAPARADWYYPNADSSLHTYCYTPTFTTDKTVGSYAMWVLGSTTDMSVGWMPCKHETDVWWWEANLPGGLRGRYSCFDWDFNWHYFLVMCETADVILDYAQLDLGGNDWHDRRKTSVHEVGHSVGLSHGNSDAMISGEVPSTDLQWRRYSGHHRGHINFWY